jgi:hypothetical protein
MNTLPTFIPARRRIGRKRRRPTAQVAPLTLTGAGFTLDGVDALLTLSFDRDITIDFLDGSAITVDDASDSSQHYAATGPATLTSAQSVEIECIALGPATGGGVRLNATSANGIRDEIDGTVWSGVTEVELPFP